MSAAPSLPAYSMNREDFPQMYERCLVGPLFRPWAIDLLAGVALTKKNARVLDIACGTGIVARLAQQRLGNAGRVVGVDVSAPMLAVARANEPQVDWREGDATSLPIADDEKFDLVACQQGLQFFADRDAAAREMRRVLAPGGTALVATWRSNDEMPVLRDLQTVAERHLGAIVDQRHAFPDDAALERLLVGAGFDDVTVERRSLTMHFANGSEFVHMNAMAFLGMSGAIADPAERERLVGVIARESADAVRAHFAGAALAFDMSANIATAR
jgi:SAM-dependent methyltransferase